jgi:hypothetical protein
MFVGRRSGPGLCVEKILLVNTFNGDAMEIKHIAIMFIKLIIKAK